MITVEEIVKSYWKDFGRNLYRIYDYENLESADGYKVFERIESLFGVFESEG